MVCQFQPASSLETSSNFDSHIAPVSPEEFEVMEMESPSEISVFLPRETDYSDGNENERRLSRNLGILVISEAIIPLETQKAEIESEEISTNPYAPTTTAIQSDCEVGEKRGERKSCLRNYTGILLTLTSGLVYTMGAVIVKYMKDYHPFTLGVYRFQGVLLPSLLMVLYVQYVQKVPILSQVWPLTNKTTRKRLFGMILRCAFGTTALLLHFFALQRLDVADVAVISSCQPVFVTLAAYVFLGESCGVFPICTALLTIIGVGVISRPPVLTGAEAFNEEVLVGAGFAMASVIAATVVFVIIRYLKDVHVTLLTLILGCWGTTQSAICALTIGEFKLPQSGEDWLLACGLAGITLLGQLTMTLALQCEQAGPVALVRTGDCIFAFVLQFILLNTVPDLYSLTGACIVIFCVILTALRKWITTLPDGHPSKNRLWFVTK